MAGRYRSRWFALASRSTRTRYAQHYWLWPMVKPVGISQGRALQVDVRRPAFHLTAFRPAIALLTGNLDCIKLSHWGAQRWQRDTLCMTARLSGKVLKPISA